MATKKAATTETNAAEARVNSIKGFDSKLQCRGFQFELGKTYTVEGAIEACNNGFHACPVDQHPLSVFEYYPPAGARYAEVIQSGATDKQDTKLASATISLKVEISLGELAQRAVKWVFDRADWKNAANVTGEGEGATASGDSGAATASGVRGAATASGYSGAATASGDSGAATASGDSGAATASGEKSAALASGRDGRARAAEGCALFLVYRDDDWNIVAAWAGIAGRDGVKPDAWYSLGADGKPFECDAEDAS